MAKTLHWMKEEGEFDLKGKNIIDIGSGVGLLGLYLAALGANVTLCDVPVMRDLI